MFRVQIVSNHIAKVADKLIPQFIVQISVASAMSTVASGLCWIYCLSVEKDVERIMQRALRCRRRQAAFALESQVRRYSENLLRSPGGVPVAFLASSSDVLREAPDGSDQALGEYAVQVDSHHGRAERYSIVERPVEQRPDGA